MISFYRSVHVVLFTSLTLTLASGGRSSLATPLIDDYDRLDGVGKSGKTVQVIEWEGNLEVHVYPGGSLKGLGLKLDTREKNKKVMVLAYRLADAPLPVYVRRAILSIPMGSKFNVYLDPSTRAEYDKIIISGNQLAGGLVPFKLDPEPKQLYPEGHPANELTQQPSRPEPQGPAESLKPPLAPRAPSSETDDGPRGGYIDTDDGTIRPFSW